MIAVVALAVAFVWYQRSHATSKATAAAPLRVETLTIRPQSVPDVIETFGTVVSHQTVEVTPQTGGTITSVRIRDGEPVHRGS